MDLQHLKFPIGEYIPTKAPDRGLLKQWIDTIATFPKKLEDITKNASLEQLNWRYRPDGWKAKQVIHHCADSHMNSFIRFKLALTEDTPAIRPYYEDRWAELFDSQDDNILDTLQLLKGLHKKWVLLLNSLSEKELKLEFIHPEHGKKFNLAENIGNYAWHCDHHFAHVKNALASNGKHN